MLNQDIDISFELLFRVLPVACLLCDIRGNILQVNPSAQLLLHEAGDVRDKNIRQLIPNLSLAQPDSIAGASMQEIHCHILCDGFPQHVSVQCVALHDKTNDYLLVVIFNDRRRQAEQALQNILQTTTHSPDSSPDSMAEQLKLAALTEREKQVMSLAVVGYHNKEIARALGISHRTVEIHKSRIMHKTGASNLLDLARMANAAHLAIRS